MNPKTLYKIGGWVSVLLLLFGVYGLAVGLLTEPIALLMVVPAFIYKGMDAVR